jgi:hypothetical protein
LFSDNSVSFESGFGRFVPVRPQPRALPLNVQNRENIVSDHHEDANSSNISGHTLHPYAHQMQNGKYNKNYFDMKILNSNSFVNFKHF